MKHRTIIKIIIIIAVFLMPLFYIPFTQDPFQFNKEMLLFLAMLIAGALWLGRAIYEKKLKIARGVLDIPVLLALLVYTASTITSVDRLSSLLNLQGNGIAGLLAVIALTLFYFLTVNKAFDGINSIHLALKFTLLSSFLVQIIAFLSFFKIYFLPGQHESFTTLGSMGNVSVYAASLIPISLYFFLRKSEKRAFSFLTALPSGAYLIVSAVLLNTINFTVGWIVAAAGVIMFLFLCIAFYDRITLRMRFLWLPALILAISLTSLILKPPSVLVQFLPAGLKPNIPAEVSLSLKASQKIAVSSTFQGVAPFLFGTGSGNFAYSFSKERPVSFNSNALWDVRFFEAGNFPFEVIATLGWVGFLSVLLLFIFYAIATISFLIKSQGRNNAVKGADSLDIATARFALITAFSVFFGVLAGLWFSASNTALLSLVWLLFAVTSAIGVIIQPQKQAETISLNFHSSRASALILSFGLVSAFALSLFFIGFAARVYLAEYHYSKAFLARREGTYESMEKAHRLLAKAIQLHDKRGEYYLNFAEVSTQLIRLEVQRQQNSKDADKTQDSQKIQSLIANAVNGSQAAVNIQSRSPVVWEKRGLTLEAVNPFISGAREFAIAAFKRASELEPTNPFLYFKIGENQRLLWLEKKNAQAALSNGDDLQKQEKEKQDDISLLQEAARNLQKAVELKPDFLPSYISLTYIAEAKDDTEGALNHLKAGVDYAMREDQAQFYYETARIMYNKLLKDKDQKDSEKLKEILEIFNQALTISPNYADALYTRSFIHEQLGGNQEAVKDMEQVIALNPDNADAQKRLKNLKNEEDSVESIPSITSIAPDSGTIGETVTIRGSSLSPADTIVQFGAGYIKNFTSINGTDIQFVVPEKLSSCLYDQNTKDAQGQLCQEFFLEVTAGIYPITVINANGQSNTVMFTVANRGL